VHRLASVADKVAKIAKISNNQKFTQFSVSLKPLAVIYVLCSVLTKNIDTPICKILLETTSRLKARHPDAVKLHQAS